MDTIGAAAAKPEVSVGAWPREDASRIPLWVYSDPDNYARELERIFYGPHWHFIGVDCEVPNPGDYKRATVGERSVLMVRGEDGGVNVLNNSCAHRGTEVCRARFGNQNPIICPYHQWTYDLAGNLRGVPFRKGIKGQGGYQADFDMAEHGLRRLKVARVNGGIWATFDPSAASFEDYIGPTMLRYLTRVFNGKKLRVLGYERQRLRGNWKHYMENIKDPYHATLLHVFLISFGIYRVDQKGVYEQDERTHAHSVVANVRDTDPDPAAAREMRSLKAGYKLLDPRMVVPVKEFPDDISIMVQTLFPNLVVQQQTNSLQLRYVTPLGPEEFDLAWTYLGYADDDEEMTLRRLRQANLTGICGYVSIDDSEALEFSGAGARANRGGQAVLEFGGRAPTVPPGNHQFTESAIRGFYTFYREVMGYR
jgi:phenylpropionate dioxygenase-like ring-hydroxylating dioxygenase large terminal subunit